jgi:predicted alpha/beta-hydrolase family hydrolase
MKILWQNPTDAVAVVVLAHGAGAGMAHSNMQAIADAFERLGIATLRFNFPFIEQGKNRVDSQSVATATIAEAVGVAKDRTELPLRLGGHSFGGRMASHAVIDQSLKPVGLVFCSFPLHPPGKPGVERAAHLPAVGRPMLFLSGTRDEFSEGDLLEQVVAGLPKAELHRLGTANHGYQILKRTRTSKEDVFDEMARVARDFIDRHAEPVKKRRPG